MCTSITFDVDGKEPTEAMKDKISSLRTRSIRLLILVEQHAPATFFAQYMHELVHVVDSTARWGSARNFWSFFAERYCTYICKRTIYIIQCMYYTCTYIYK